MEGKIQSSVNGGEGAGEGVVGSVLGTYMALPLALWERVHLCVVLALMVLAGAIVVGAGAACRVLGLYTLFVDMYTTCRVVRVGLLYVHTTSMLVVYVAAAVVVLADWIGVSRRYGLRTWGGGAAPLGVVWSVVGVLGVFMGAEVVVQAFYNFAWLSLGASFGFTVATMFLLHAGLQGRFGRALPASFAAGRTVWLLSITMGIYGWTAVTIALHVLPLRWYYTGPRQYRVSADVGVDRGKKAGNVQVQADIRFLAEMFELPAAALAVALREPDVRGLRGLSIGVGFSDRLRGLALIGDRVMGLALARCMFDRGQTVAAASFTSQTVVTNVAFARWFDAVVVSRYSKEVSFCSTRVKGTFVEAVVGAAYVGGCGLEVVERFVARVAETVGIAL